MFASTNADNVKRIIPPLKRLQQWSPLSKIIHVEIILDTFRKGFRVNSPVINDGIYVFVPLYLPQMRFAPDTLLMVPIGSQELNKVVVKV